MSSLIDLASLVLAPTATKEGKVYSAIPDTGDGDMTFTRGSAATRVNSAGLIEKERGNLLLQSNTFDVSATWALTNAPALTSGQSGYDGTNDAWKLEATTTGSSRSIHQIISTSGVQVFSVYVKAGTTDWIRINLSGIGNRYFDIGNGVVGGSGNIDGFITDVGGGWYRCSVLGNGSSTAPYIFLASDNGNLAVNAGDNIYIQDAMLNEGLVATDYIETTTSAVYEGITDDVPRVDYSGGGCPSLLLESQRTNSYTNSEYFDDWLSNRLDRTANNIISPEGVQNAYKMAQQSGFTTAPNINKGGIAAGTYTVSIFAKKGSWNYLAISFQGVSYFNLEAGSKGTINSNHTATIEDYGNGWYRCAITRTTTTTQTPAFYFAESDNTLTTPDTQGYMYAYGAMLEAGSYSTSYIPTYSVSSTRVADSCSKTGISELIGQTEGTLFGEFFVSDIVTAGSYVRTLLNDGSSVNQIAFFYYADGRIQATSSVGGSLVVSINIPSYGLLSGKHKFAFSYKLNDYVLFIDGVNVGANTSATVPSMSVFNLYDTSGGSMIYNQAILFPTRLTNDQLEELTK